MSDRKIRQADGVLRNIHDPATGPVLPKDGERNVLITSALPYVNNVPHLGNIIGSTLSADVFARYNRTRNTPTIYICGTDEYGTATETKALEEKMAPYDLCTKFWKLHTEVYEWFEIGFDKWGRTSTPAHTKVTQDVFQHLHKNDFIELQTEEQTYCEDDQLFLADRFVEGTCPNCGYDDARGDQCDKCALTFGSPTELLHPRCKRNKSHKVSVRPSTHAYFRLNKVQPALEEFIQKQRVKGKQAGNVVVNDKGEIIEPRMLGGLRPSPVTRDLKWGVPVPVTGDEKTDSQLASKVFYVWFDAVLGYPSITATYTDEWQKWWHNPENVELYQFMGKDNVYFHQVLFPSMLIADGRNWTKVHRISATQYLNYEDTKFSKSRGVGVFGTQAAETGQPASAFRYYLLSQRPESADTAFQWSSFIAAVNNELLNNLGNFTNRVIKFVNAKYDSIVPGPKADSTNADYDKIDAAFVQDVNEKLAEYIEAMDGTKIRLGLSTMMSISARGNQYLQDNSLDNALLANHPERCATVVLNAINLIYILTALIHPFMPATARDIEQQLNVPPRTVAETFSIDILPGHHIGKAKHLFKRIDNPEAQEAAWKAQFGGTDATTTDAPVANGAAVKAPKSKGGANWEQTAAKKKAAAAAADAAKSPEERALEAKLQAQNDIIKSIRLKKTEGDVEKETALQKQIKAELADLRKKLKEVKI